MSFINPDFMLQTETARKLYHEHAEKMPIIDYHCHLVPQQIAENIQFRDITQLWLVDGHYGDHYKWRAMRANGVSEDYLTGGKYDSWETFKKWAETVPYTMRNPLYHWTHLELSRVFGIDKLLCPATAREIFEECNAKLATPEFRGQALIRRFNVVTVCTTDDPADDLRWHKKIAAEPFGTKVIPAWRPDKAMAIENPAAYRAYLKQLGETDSERILLRLMDLLLQKERGLGREVTREERFSLWEDEFERMAPGNKLNILFYYEDTLYVHTNCEKTLYMREGNGFCVFATVPLDSCSWKPVPMMRLLAFDNGCLTDCGRCHGCAYRENIEDLKYLYMAYAGL